MPEHYEITRDQHGATIWRGDSPDDPAPVEVAWIYSDQRMEAHAEYMPILEAVLAPTDEQINAVAMAICPDPERHLQGCPVWTQRRHEGRRDPCSCHWSDRAQLALAALREIGGAS